MANLSWFFSQTVRHACTVHKHYRRLLAAQSDILATAAVVAVQVKLDELKAAIAEGHTGRINIKAEELQFAAEKNLKPYPNASYRENVEVLLVALAVAMAIRTFFLQPFKIPTGSMQPTLFGVNSQNLMGDKHFVMPTGWERVKEWFEGFSYIHIVATADGPINSLGPMKKFLIFNLMQTITIGGVTQTMWFPPDYGEAPRGQDPLAYRAGLDPDHVYRKGDDVVYLKVSAGDHLFVDRVTYNFRRPDRGDTVVFETAGIPEDEREHWGIPADQFYIKRLVGLPGEHIQIGDDRHLRINGERLDASTPHFERVYGFDPKQPPHDSEFSGHVNGTVALQYGLSIGILPLFPDANAFVDVPTNSCLVMGDNTCNSLDSRFWGPIPESHVIGKSFFVYWPLTSRFGWSNR
jgi:signal peptidase I